MVRPDGMLTMLVGFMVVLLAVGGIVSGGSYLSLLNLQGTSKNCSGRAAGIESIGHEAAGV